MCGKSGWEKRDVEGNFIGRGCLQHYCGGRRARKGRTQRATHFPRASRTSPTVAHRWRSFPILQRRDPGWEKSKHLAVGGGTSRFSPLPCLPPRDSPWPRIWTLPRVPTPGSLRGLGMMGLGCEGEGRRALPLHPTSLPASAPHKAS